MNRNYRILEKARLTDKLFGAAEDGEALAQEEAELAWADDVSAAANGPRSDLAPDNPPPAPLALETASPAPATEPLPPTAATRAVETPAAEPPAGPAVEVEPLESGLDWTVLLAGATGAQRLQGVRELLLCPATSKVRAAPLLVALSNWARDHHGGKTLLVEASFRAPRLAALADCGSLGLDALPKIADGNVRKVVRPTRFEDVWALPAGKPTHSPQQRLESYETWLPKLREGFDTLLIETPAADDSALKRFPFAAHEGGLLLVIDPQTVSAGRIERAVARLRELGARYVAAVLSRH